MAIAEAFGSSGSKTAGLRDGRQTTNAMTELLRRRVSVRAYKRDPVSDDMLWAILEATRKAPTSSNLQATSLVIVRDAERRRSISELAGNQRHIKEAPVFVAICADLSRIVLAGELHGKAIATGTLEMHLVASLDAAFVGMCASLAAESFGLGSVMIGGMRNHPVEAARLLNLPPLSYVVFGLCLGWPAQAPKPKPRHAANLAVHFERYEERPLVESLSDYDGELATHYHAIGKATNPQSWTHQTALEFSEPRRANLRDELTILGFGFS